MVDYEHLRNAPIVEAIIDFRVSLSSDIGFKHLEKVAKELQAEYPLMKVHRKVVNTLKPDESGHVEQSVEESMIGFILASKDERHVIQLNLEGFTLSELKPYTSWKEFLPRAESAWKIFRKITECDTVTRIATRYINKLPLPMGDKLEFDDYLTAAPPIPKSLPQTIAGFFSKMTLVDPDTQCCANVTQASEGADKDTLAVLLDIDAYKNMERCDGGDLLWNVLETLKELENRVFFEYITPKAKELFK